MNASVSFMESFYDVGHGIGRLHVFGVLGSFIEAHISLLHTVTALAVMILISPFFIVATCINKGRFCKWTKEAWDVAICHLIMGTSNFGHNLANICSLGFHFYNRINERKRMFDEVIQKMDGIWGDSMDSFREEVATAETIVSAHEASLQQSQAYLQQILEILEAGGLPQLGPTSPSSSGA